MNRFDEDIKQAGLRVTQPRTVILKLFEQAEQKHLSAEDVYHRLLNQENNIGLATIYRVLNQFETAGLLAKHSFENGHSVYELNEGEHHDHMVDVKTGEILEFHDEIIEQRQLEIAKQHGFELSDHSLVLYGRFTRNKA